MGIKFSRLNRKRKRLLRSFKRATKSRLPIVLAVAVALLILMPDGKETRNVNYAGLLNTIAKGESRGDYNAYYGNAQNTSIKFTEMTVGEVLHWQDDYVKNGSPSNAVGKYQFIRPTLSGLVDELKIDKNSQFDEQLQDRLAVALLERRGLNEYVDGKISKEQFAHNLSKEWAALPSVMGADPNASYYAGDGLNKVQVSVDEVYLAINTL